MTSSWLRPHRVWNNSVQKRKYRSEVMIDQEYLDSQIYGHFQPEDSVYVHALSWRQSYKYIHSTECTKICSFYTGKNFQVVMLSKIIMIKFWWNIWTYVPLLYLEKMADHSAPVVASRLATIVLIPSRTLFSGVILLHRALLELPMVVSWVTCSRFGMGGKHY